jgi:hypothetical protein
MSIAETFIGFQLERRPRRPSCTLHVNFLRAVAIAEARIVASGIELWRSIKLPFVLPASR